MRSEGELDILSVQNTQNSAHLLSKLQVVLEYLVWILYIGFGFGGDTPKGLSSQIWAINIMRLLGDQY